MAEVLVTLGIIGVVSSMTIPTLMQNHQKKVYVTQLHKVYNEIQQAAEMMLEDKNAVDLIEARLFKGNEGEFLKSYFKLAKDCGYSSNNCFYASYRSFLPSVKTKYAYTKPDNVYTVITASGVSIGLQLVADSSEISKFSGAIGYVYVDVNSLKGPNKCGRDYFSIMLYADGSVDDLAVTPACRASGECGLGFSSAQALRNRNYNVWCKKGDGLAGCFGKILNDNWEMNY